MGTRIWMVVILTAVLAVTAGQAMATSIATEFFNYVVSPATSTELNGKSGGTGWSGAWTAVTASTEVVKVATPVQYNAGTWVVGGGSDALQITGNNDNLIYRQLSAIQSGDVWTSFLARWDGGAVGTNDFAAFWFGNSASGSHTTAPNIGLKTNLGSTGPGGDVPPGVTEDFVVRLNDGANADYAGNITRPDTTGHLIVGHLYKTLGSTRYNAFEMWVDPDANNLVGDRSANRFVYAIDNTGSPSLTSFNMIGIRTAHLSGDTIMFDQLRLGTTMSDVLAGGSGGSPPMVPEPVTMAGLMLGIGGVAQYVRKRRM